MFVGALFLLYQGYFQNQLYKEEFRSFKSNSHVGLVIAIILFMENQMDSTAKKDLIYIHGWNSSGNARKPRTFRNELTNNAEYEVVSYTLKSHPREAIKQFNEIIKSEESRKVRDRSSLGGYYVHLAESLDLKLLWLIQLSGLIKFLRMIEKKLKPQY